MMYVLLSALGLLLGSFVNALVWRLFKQAEVADGSNKKRLSKSDQKKLKKLSIATGRSMCSHCEHPLSSKDLVPVLSWLWLKGKCRYCGQPIADTPFAELLLPVLMVVSYVLWPFASDGWSLYDGIGFGLWVAILVCFVALIIYDAKWYLLPHRLVIPVTLLALLFVTTRAVEEMNLGIFGWAVLGAVTISGVFKLLSLISKGAWIGGGDINLGISLGLIVGGPIPALLVLFVSSLLGTLAVIPSVLVGKRGMRSMLPFGPFLIAGTLIVFLWGDAMLNWYFALLSRT